MLRIGIAGLGDQLFGHSAAKYDRYQPEQTVLFQAVDKYC